MFPRLVSSWRWPWHERGNNQLPFSEIYPEDLNSRFEDWTTDNCDNGLKGRICKFGFSNNPRSSFEQRKPDIMVNTFGGPNSLFEHWNCSKHCWEWACAWFLNLQVGSEHLIWMRSDIGEDSLLLLDALRTTTQKKPYSFLPQQITKVFWDGFLTFFFIVVHGILFKLLKNDLISFCLKANYITLKDQQSTYI